MKALVLLAFSILFIGKNQAQDGSPDPSFGGGDGMVFNSIFDNEPSWGLGIAVQQDNKSVISGSTKAPDGFEHAFLARFIEDGELDNSFNGSGKIVLDLSEENSYSRDIKIQPDGKILICAQSDDSTGTRAWVIRFDEDGIPDNSFSGDGQAYISIGSKFFGARALALQPDGKILMGGYVGGDYTDSFFVARFLSNGTLDNSFDGDGIAKTVVGDNYSSLSNLLVQPDGKIIAIGTASFSGNDDFAVVRYNGNGTLDTSFSGNGITHITFSNSDDRAYGGLIQPDGKLVVSGLALNTVTNKNDFAAARVNLDGTLDESFHGTGMALTYITEFSDGAYAILRQPDGKYVMGGFAHSDVAGGGSALTLARLNENGTLDNTFDEDGIYTIIHPGLESTIYNMAMQSDGKIVSVGTHFISGFVHVMLFRTLTGLTTETNEVNEAVSGVSLYPNPVSESIVLKYSLEQPKCFQIVLCDAFGKTVDQLVGKEERSAGSHEEYLELSRSLAAGCYFIKLETSDGVKTIPVIKE